MTEEETEKTEEARKWLEAMAAKRRERATLNQSIRNAAYKGDWNAIDRITDKLIGDFEGEVSEDLGETEVSPPTDNNPENQELDET